MISNQFLESLGIENPSDLIGKKFVIHIKQPILPSNIDNTVPSEFPVAESVPEEKDFECMKM